MNILLLTRYGRQGASSRIRMLQYLPFLESRGHTVTLAPLFSDNYLTRAYSGLSRSPMQIVQSYVHRLQRLSRTRQFDLLWIEKELFPYLPAWIERLLGILDIPVLVDYDDAIFHSYDLHPNPLFRQLMAGKIDAVMRNASLVIAGNEYLANRARRAGARRVVTIPSVVDVDLYRMASEPKKTEAFRIGWIGSPSTAKYLVDVVPALTALHKLGDIEVVLVGSGPVQMDGLSVDMRTWSEEAEAEDAASFDVGIMPLHNGPWERGKCGYKLIQYMAAGVATVASPVGVNTSIVDHGVTGFLAHTPDEWIAALSRLRDDPLLRRQMGDLGRQKVQRKFSVQAAAPLLISSIESLTRYTYDELR